jgi:transposase
MPDEDRAELTRWTRAPSLRAGLAQRARIVLLADEGVGTNEIVTRVGVSKPTVIAWKKRYAAGGIAGLGDRPKPGRPARVDEIAVVLATLQPPRDRLGVTHWSSRLLAEQLGISNVWVARIWRKWAATLAAADVIETFIEGWNERCQPFTWTKTADEILSKPPAVKDHRSPDASNHTPTSRAT